MRIPRRLPRVRPPRRLAPGEEATLVEHLDELRSRLIIGLLALVVWLVFELPIFILALVRLGVLSTRTLRKKRKVGLFIMACIAVALPGIDPVTTTFEMLPLMALFEGSIWLSVFFERRWSRHAA